LQEPEAIFRLGKSDLRLRPIFHRQTERLDAHILVCFLALEMWMKGKRLGACARKLVAAAASIKSMDVVLPVRTAQGTADMRLRVVSKPDRMVAQLVHSGIGRDPVGTEAVSDFAGIPVSSDSTCAPHS